MKGYERCNYGFIKKTLWFGLLLCMYYNFGVEYAGGFRLLNGIKVLTTNIKCYNMECSQDIINAKNMLLCCII